MTPRAQAIRARKLAGAALMREPVALTVAKRVLARALKTGEHWLFASLLSRALDRGLGVRSAYLPLQTREPSGPDARVVRRLRSLRRDFFLTPRLEPVRRPA